MSGPLPRGITDVHVHLQRFDGTKPSAESMLRERVRDYPRILSILKDPRSLLQHLDRAGVERACLINYPAPEVLGLEADGNEFLAGYVREDPKRLIAVGSVNPRIARDPAAEVEDAVTRLGVRALKVHPPHQLVAANAYVDGKMPGLAEMYRAAERLRVPVMVHTGTSVFPGARSRLGDPMDLDDVAQDFPELTVVMSHGGRPLWCDTAFYLVRRHPNIYLDISGIPPGRLLRYFPRLAEIGDKVLFGSDWPGPDVPGIREEIEALQALPLPPDLAEKLLVTNARRIFP